MLKVMEREVVPWCEEDDIDLLIMDNDPKLNSKNIVQFMASKGVPIYPVGGKIPG